MTYVTCKEESLIDLMSNFSLELVDVLGNAWPWNAESGGELLMLGQRLREVMMEGGF